ncbi:S-adenosyl-L-methionine-dependent methyltransferase [Podospora aff. communis PSN243]|uniref:S-adenosyl-L-methionine-dependent methyltransferase n=1 Tax=Podospora aff. communis PSN243 TaxID=3040156 RepID=A0AAV9G9M6_9PEZI|nr:S-adenosyl-L-methionine-dependent methyltransferase [Podospora aff. communis PSN243]
MASPDLSADPAPEVGRLQATFQAHPFSAHGAQWDQLWKESYSPWDRGGPSLALNDLLEQHPRLFPSITGRKPRALVPGCGRGHDVLLLSAFGYDVTGLDVSETSLKEAAENERANSGQDIYAVREGIAAEKGKVTWMAADFFDSENPSLKPASFDLIYDYTFFCAVPPEGRPKWAKRMSELLNPDGGRLVCLEWPLRKPLSSGGPPWGLVAEAYVAHLSHPGEDIAYNETGPVMESLPTAPSPTALRQLARIKPTRTFKAGTDESGEAFDFISVWSH